MSVSRIIILVLIGVFILQGIFYYPSLPDVMASHFDGAGNPDRWMTKPVFFVFEAVVLGLMLFVFLALPKLTAKAPKKWVNLPNKDYWLADERCDETYKILAEYNNWFCVGLILLFIAVNHFVFQANIEKTPLPTAAMWIVLITFFLFIIIWTILLLYRFRKPN